MEKRVGDPPRWRSIFGGRTPSMKETSQVPKASLSQQHGASDKKHLAEVR